MQAVCLFDIDGTLLNTGGAGQRAMERALARICGLTRIDGDIPAAGRTDRAITHDLFERHQIAATPQLWSDFQDEYARQLPISLGELDGQVLPGVRELLAELAAAEHIALGLLTGNFRTGALQKLQHYRLDQHFAFGGYGDHHHDRDDVARVAFAAACQHLQTTPPAGQVWVLGDTPADVRCGRAIDARVVAVATGIFSRDELAACEPDLLFDDFSRPAELLASLIPNG